VAWVRTVKTASGATAVQVVWASRQAREHWASRLGARRAGNWSRWGRRRGSGWRPGTSSPGPGPGRQAPPRGRGPDILGRCFVLPV